MFLIKNDAVRRLKTRKVSLQFKLVIFIVILVTVSNVLLAVGLYRGAKNIIETQVRSKIVEIAKSTAVMLDGDVIEKLEIGDCSSDDFLSQLKVVDVMAKNSEAEYIYAFKFDENGNQRFVLDSDYEDINDLDTIGTSYTLMPEMQDAYEGIATTDREANTDEWGTFLSGYSPIYNSKESVVGIVGVDFEYSDIIKEINKLRVQIIFIFCVVAAVTIVGCYIIIRALRRYFNILNDKIRELANGSGDLNRKVVIETGDEFEIIADSINAFIDEVKSLVKTVALKADETAKSMNSINSKVTELSANMEECSATTQTASDNLDTAAKRVEDMSDMVSITDKKVSDAFDEAIMAAEKAKEHKENAVADINKIQDEIRIASDKAQAVNQVKEITKQIEKIASESKILALNAEIEAARAGEAGRGFAIVAEEMGALNTQIAESVSEIANINDTVLESVKELIAGTKQIDEYLTSHVLPDYDEYAELGLSYGNMTKGIRDDMEALTNQTGIIVSEVNYTNDGIRDISSAVLESANAITDVNLTSTAIAENMEKLTQISMLKMVK